jgi:hypothetical protein
VEVDRFEDGDAPRHALDRDSGDGRRVELAVLADPERRVVESRLYRAKVDEAYGVASDAHTQSLPELSAIRARRVEVFDRIEVTQAPRERMQVSRGWELIFSEPRGAGTNPVLKHARYIGGSGS